MNMASLHTIERRLSSIEAQRGEHGKYEHWTDDELDEAIRALVRSLLATIGGDQDQGYDAFRAHYEDAPATLDAYFTATAFEQGLAPEKLRDAMMAFIQQRIPPEAA